MVELFKLRKFILLISFLAVLLAGPAVSLAQSASSGLYINNFRSDYGILDDSWVEVKETIDITYTTPHHGIYRDIPYRYHDSLGNIRNIRIDVVNVANEDGEGYTYEKSRSDGDVSLKIGDANYTVEGDFRYIITYKVWGAINYFDDEAEFYWNATGNDWLIPIYNAEARVNIKDENCLDITGFQGYEGSNEGVNESFDNKCSWMATRALNAGEGLTVVARWPKDLTPPPSTATKVGLWLLWNWIYFLPLMVFIFALIAFLRKGRDPKGRGTIVAEFESPNKLTALEIGALYDNKAQGRDFSAMIIGFAVNGYLKIKELEKRGIFGKIDYEFNKVKDLPNKAKGFEKIVFEKLFEGGESVKLSSLNEKFFKTKKDAERDVFSSLVNDGYYNQSPLMAGVANYVIGGIFFFVGFFASAMFEEVWGVGFTSALISFMLSGVILIIFGSFMSRRTKKGAETREKIAGLKLYLETAEKYRMKFAEEQKLFEKFLPYAMALGVAGIWSKKFKNIYKEGETPGWYSGYHGAAFTAFAFTNSLNNNFAAAVDKSFTSTPASSGSSGFSGGGFSGGGMGGGGGGGW